MNKIKELSFSEYFKSKETLLEKADESPRIYSYYEVRAYRKVPLLENYDDEEKIYIAFKPKDKIKILWEYENIHFPTARNFIIINEDGIETYYPAWSNKKLLKWVMNNAVELKHDSIS